MLAALEELAGDGHDARGGGVLALLEADAEALVAESGLDQADAVAAVESLLEGGGVPDDGGGDLVRVAPLGLLLVAGHSGRV